MAFILPPLETKGIYVLKSPFTAAADTVYTTQAHRTIEEMIDRKLDPFELVYQPNGLTQDQYQQDKDEGVVIVTLMSADKPTILVPNRYIETYPNMGVVPHSHVVMVADCGMLPDHYDLSLIESAIQSVVVETTGVVVEVKSAVVPTSDAISEAQYAQLLAARQAAITTREDPYAKILELNQQLQDSQDTITELLRLIEELQA